MNKAERTRSFIIQQVAPVFNKKGFAGTSLTDMTQATGLTKGSIYGNFRNKDEVALEAFLHNLNLMTAEIKAEVARYSTASDKLRAYLRYFRQNFSAIFKRGGCAIMNAAIDSDDSNEMILAEARKALNSFKHSIEEIVRQGKDSGELTIANPEKFSCLMVSLWEGSILLAKTTNKPEYLLYNADFLEEYINSHTRENSHK